MTRRRGAWPPGRVARRPGRNAACAGLLALSLRPAAAAAEDVAALMARAPAITLDGAVTPLDRPLDLGGAGWGPFSRLCVATFVRRDDGGDTPLADPTCFNVEAAREHAGIWHLTLRADPLRGGRSLAFNTTRDAQGVVGPVQIIPPEGAPAAPPAALARLATVFGLALQTHGPHAATIQPDAPFVLPSPVGAVDPDMRVDGGGFICRPEGTATARGRPVLVASCSARAAGRITLRQSVEITMAGRFVLDTATGMVLQHGYSAWVQTDTDPRAANGRRDVMRTLSRQSLE